MNYALLVGINKYAQPGNDLRGCVNDVTAMRALLTRTYGFAPENIRLLTDRQATQQAILEQLEWLIGSARPGDQLVWHYAGHGSQVRDTHGDELDDYLDEIICPYDLDWDHPLTDDLIAERFRQIPVGALLNFIADCCHSGSVSREIPRERDAPATLAPTLRFLPPPTEIADRCLERPGLPVRRFGRRWPISAPPFVPSTTQPPNSSTTQPRKLPTPQPPNHPTSQPSDITFADQRHLLLSGCRDNQTSADALFNGKPGGALTTSLVQALTAEPKQDWLALHATIKATLRAGGFAQVPQLTGPRSVLEKVVFS
jgi:metacaspase-1